MTPSFQARHRQPHRIFLMSFLLCLVFLAELIDIGVCSHHRRRSHRSHHHQHHQHTSNEVDSWGAKEPIRSPNSILPGPVKPLPPQQVFISDNCTIVLAQTGSTPILHCEVQDIGEGTVSWIRRKDYRLLTVGLATYSSDDRFFTAHVHNPQDWALHVRFAQTYDGGLYECQVSTHPPTSLFVELQLVEATAEVLGGPDKFVKSGSSLRLMCLLRRSTEVPAYVFWYHEDRMINYDAGRGVRVRHARYSSELVVAEAHKHDSGNYTCVPSNAKPASIIVHILNGEEPAAMQHGSKSSSPSLELSSLLTSTLSVLVLLSASLQCSQR